jgi:hypothetical protein
VSARVHPAREYHYRVDPDGRVFHDGSEIVDPQVLRFFLRAMTRTPEGRWLVLCQGEANWFEADATPCVVQRIRTAAPRPDGSPGLDLVLAGDLVEPLDPATLEADGDRLTCRVRRGALPARFGRLALAQVAPLLVELRGGLALRLGPVLHPIPRVSPETENRP